MKFSQMDKYINDLDSGNKHHIDTPGDSIPSFLEATTSNNIFYYWTMNKYTNESKKAWRVYSNGFGMQHSVYNGNGVRPVIKVKTNLTISKGNGTWNSPYEVQEYFK